MQSIRFLSFNVNRCNFVLLLSIGMLCGRRNDMPNFTGVDNIVFAIVIVAIEYTVLTRWFARESARFI
jgi:hypothetical protein